MEDIFNTIYDSLLQKLIESRELRIELDKTIKMKAMSEFYLYKIRKNL